jgi:hypothetical protein
MFIYWLLFLVPAWGTFMKVRSTRAGRWMGWAITWLVLTVLIGYRYEVGGDWFNYLYHFYNVYYLDFWGAVEFYDPAHGAINWLANRYGWGVYGTNIIYGAIFSVGLIAFCRAQPRPLLALTVAVPYLVIVVAMGYSRQGVAIGLALFALLALAEQNRLKFVLFIALAALFHKSAVILVPIAILANTKRRFWTAVWVGATAVLMYYFYLEEATEKYVQNYLETQYASQGAQIRVAMNAVPALLFLVNRKRFKLDKQEQALWTWISLIALAFIPLLLLMPSSTAVDRVGLYFIPLQMYVFSRLPDALWRGRHQLGVRGLVVCYYALVMFVWLNYADHAQFWLPYRSYLFIDS